MYNGSQTKERVVSFGELYALCLRTSVGGTIKRGGVRPVTWKVIEAIAIGIAQGNYLSDIKITHVLPINF